MEEIDLGFAEERDSAWLTNRYFPSKIGGKPAWLNLELLPAKQILQCANCQQSMVFLCQIYAPYDDVHNFHRTLYVFYCRSEKCQVPNDSSNIIVLRSQLPKNNKFYSSEPPSEDIKPLPAVPTAQPLCLVCGCLGPYSCSRCKQAKYCSVQHQRAHYPEHKQLCGKTDNDKKSITLSTETAAKHSNWVLPELEIVTETFESETNKNDDTESELEAEKRRIAEYEKLVQEGKTGDLQNIEDVELEKYATSVDALEDKWFKRFKNAVSEEPDQVIRYKRNGKPLWITSTENTIQEQLCQIPKCEQCGAQRQFEFQIMPQMLNVLKDETLDWGVLAVYTCQASCEPPVDLAYLKEYVIKQDITSDTK